MDKLLADREWWERWGRHWLDVVRFAETNSYERDGLKPNAWKYRDLCYRLDERDKTLRQFIKEQLAGDELEQVTPETLTAPAIIALVYGMTNQPIVSKLALMNTMTW